MLLLDKHGMKQNRTSNSKLHPEAWKFWVKQCRNITEEPEINQNNKFMYRIPIPDESGRFLYGINLRHMWNSFIVNWYSPKLGLNAPSIYGKIQYIVKNFK